ncbi:type IV toxin-antitoxin system AbiEi family antitoxin domain-containing protein [Paludibacterium denitrificans]|uniref:type IV toxin-antitoxin system AbiEi family antitoxin domain-containing protein n=1 Tax=Paludibacterium denitrificans TaxID=2675226 RepID=UPI001E58E56C|nr:type IV toxin-antitoxin system AbiEi family antitoxin domain-containing protein [Paludibacterium denitrificans]
MPYQQHLRTLHGGHPEVFVSCRERAILELISDIGRGQSLEEVRNMFVGLRNIRPAVMAELLDHCHRVKVVRLVRDLAQQEDYDWATIAQVRADALSSGKRWSMVGPDGERLTLKP